MFQKWPSGIRMVLLCSLHCYGLRSDKGRKEDLTCDVSNQSFSTGPPTQGSRFHISRNVSILAWHDEGNKTYRWVSGDKVVKGKFCEHKNRGEHRHNDGNGHANRNNDDDKGRGNDDD